MQRLTFNQYNKNHKSIICSFWSFSNDKIFLEIIEQTLKSICSLVNNICSVANINGSKAKSKCWSNDGSWFFRLLILLFILKTTIYYFAWQVLFYMYMYFNYAQFLKYEFSIRNFVKPHVNHVMYYSKN